MTFRLKRHGREPYEHLLVTDPPILAWEASFDDGATWHPGTAIPGDPGWYGWLIAGDLADPGTAVAVLEPGEHQPQARGVAAPALIVRDLENIRVT